MNKNKITLLDLGGVVFQSSGISNEKVNWEIISNLNEKYAYRLNIGEDLFSAFLKEYNLLSKQMLIGSEFLKEVFNTLDINKELIIKLREINDIIIVSDNYRENIAYISKRYHFEAWSIKQIYSFEYKMEKSNPRFFQKLLLELKDYKSNQMIFIDDSIEKINSAEKSGIKGILYQNNNQVLKDLKEI